MSLRSAQRRPVLPGSQTQTPFSLTLVSHVPYSLHPGWQGIFTACANGKGLGQNKNQSETSGGNVRKTKYRLRSIYHALLSIVCCIVRARFLTDWWHNPAQGYRALMRMPKERKSFNVKFLAFTPERIVQGINSCKILPTPRPLVT